MKFLNLKHANTKAMKSVRNLIPTNNRTSGIENTGVYYSKTISFIIAILTIGMATIKLPILANGAALIMKKK